MATFDITIKRLAANGTTWDILNPKTDRLFNIDGDTRNTPTLPSDYNNILKLRGYKTPTGGGKHGSLIGINGYVDSSGGVIELTWNNDFFSYRTAANASTWNAWKDIADKEWANNRFVDFTSGQAVTGSKFFTNLTVRNTNDVPYMRFERLGTNARVDRLATGANGKLVMYNDDWSNLRTIANEDWVTENTRSSSWTPTWAQVSGKPTFATVATSGSYNDLSNKPTIMQVQEGINGSVTTARLINATNLRGIIEDYINNAPYKSLPLGTSRTSSFTFVIGDANRFIRCSGGAMTATVPPNSSVAFPIGTEIYLYRGSTGAVTIAAGSGVTLQSVDNKKAIAKQYQTITIKKLESNTWTIVGAL